MNLPTVLYGLIPWPHLPVLPDLPNKAALAERLGNFHSFGAWALLALVAAHTVAALRHHVVKHDDVLTRMLPRLGKAKQGEHR
jgi:cytochrome b561